MQPRLKQRKTKIVSGWLTRDYCGYVELWCEDVLRSDLEIDYYREWTAATLCSPQISREWEPDDFKALYTGIPRKGRAVWVEIEIVVD